MKRTKIIIKIGAVVLLSFLLIMPISIASEIKTLDDDVEITIPSQYGQIYVKIVNNGEEVVDTTIHAALTYKYRPDANNDVFDEANVSSKHPYYFGWFFTGFCSEIAVDVTAGSHHVVAKGIGLFGFVIITEREVLS